MSRHNETTQAIDKMVGKRIHALRVAKGISRQQLAVMVDVTHQQIHKYEKGTNRVTCGRIASIAKALEKSISYFFEEQKYQPSQHDKMCIDLSRNFLKIKNPSHQVSISYLVNSIANGN